MLSERIPISEDEVVTETLDRRLHEVAADVVYLRIAIVNVVFVGAPGAADGEWVLVDAGVAGSAPLIRSAAVARFGSASRPAGIVLTHAHFDHAGALESLAAAWDVPIWAHPLEHPYLDGPRAYPPADRTVGDGLMARLAGLYPPGPYDLTGRLRPLPEDGSLPAMPGWRWLHTPGHSAGHVALWRERDRTLIAGDAFITTSHESAYRIAAQRPELHGPPRYTTPDWTRARRSVEALAALEPERVVTGHGPAMAGAEMRRGLEALARDFDRIAVPEHGRYVDERRAG